MRSIKKKSRDLNDRVKRWELPSQEGETRGKESSGAVETHQDSAPETLMNLNIVKGREKKKRKKERQEGRK
jgi:hypothetical protein